jgi:hypothetical protein
VIDGEGGLPATVAGLFGAAYTLYVRRIGLYALLALTALAVEYVVDVALLQDSGLAIGLNIIVGSFLAATVSIGVAFDLARKATDWSTIVTAASLRWGVVAVVALVSQLVFMLFEPYVLLPPEETGYGLLLLPFIVLWGAIGIAEVVAAIEPTKSRLTLPLRALGKGLAVSCRFVNVGRLLLLSIVMCLPLFAENVFYGYLQTRAVAQAGFWAGVPIDALAAGPLQALATVFYIDFLRRAKR